MRRLLLAPVLSALLLLGCGGESEEEKAESVIRDYIGHYVDSQFAEMYALLAAMSMERCTEESFVAFISEARAALGEREFEIEEIRDVLIDGDSASATVISTVDGVEADPTENTLLREEGEWKLELPSGGC